MSRTALLRRQHDAAMALITDIRTRLAEAKPDAYVIGLSLAKLTGLLRIHLAQEDRTLYPEMIASGNSAASAAARSFQEEMGGLSQRFAEYAARWTTSRVIESALPEFRKETLTVLAALEMRIQRENEQLYPLAESMRAEPWGVRDDSGLRPAVSYGMGGQI